MTVLLILVKIVPCEKNDTPRGLEPKICVDLNGDGKPDDNFCPINGSSRSIQSMRSDISDSGKDIFTSYSHDWPALDVILEKGTDINSLADLETQTLRSSNDFCGRPMGKNTSQLELNYIIYESSFT